MSVNNAQLGIMSAFQVLLLESLEGKHLFLLDEKGMSNATGNGVLVILLKEFEEITVKSLSRHKKSFFYLISSKDIYSYIPLLVNF